MKDNFIWRNGAVEWNVIFVHAIQDWEMDVISPFFELQYSCKISQGNVIVFAGPLLEKGYLR
jgi:hypothetical protein